MTQNPKAFVSYAWESDEMKSWVKSLATELRSNGIDVKIDQWELHPGDQMPHFMERSVKENDFVLIICTPKYKIKSENRAGGVGYEGDIMTAEVLQTSNHRKFIPILKVGTIDTSMPGWLKGKYYIDFSSEHHYEVNFEDLLATLLNSREEAPKLGDIPPRFKEIHSPKNDLNKIEEDIKIKGIIVDEVSSPLNDGSLGSALYKIPFELNSRPKSEWVNIFIDTWNRPPKYSLMHRPGIAQVVGNKIILNGTTIEEVEKYHKETLKTAVEIANHTLKEIVKQKNIAESEKQRAEEEHKIKIFKASKKISFEDNSPRLPWDVEKVENDLISVLKTGSKLNLIKILKNNSFLFYEIYSRKYGIQPSFHDVIFDTNLQCDFLWLNDNSDGPEWVLVGIEKPSMKLFNRNQKPTAELNDAIERVKAWNRYFWDHPNEKNRVFGAVAKFRLVLIVGDSDSWHTEAAAKWRIHNNATSNIEIRTTGVYLRALEILKTDPNKLWSFTENPKPLEPNDFKEYWKTYSYMDRWRKFL